MEHSQILPIGEVNQSLGDVVCAMGVFDGVHAGHRKLVDDCCARAKSLGVPSVVLTFDVDPEEVFAPQRCRKLLANEDRIEMLSSLGADIVAVQHFDNTFSHLSPRDFIQCSLLAKMHPLDIYVGCDFRFGYHAQGNVDIMRAELQQHGCAVVDEQLLCEGERPVTATWIRDLLEQGQLDLANQMLGRMHFMRSKVLHGREVGRTLGYPTANLAIDEGFVQMADGVYAGYIKVGGQWFRTSVSVGVPKTFGDIASTVEAHIIDFDQDIYGQDVELCFARYLRPMMKFESPDVLVKQIEHDTQCAVELPMPPAIPFPTCV